jgi:MscS family membrane protein
MQDLIDQFIAVWNTTFIGTTVGQLAVAAIVLLVFILARRLFARLVIARLKRLTAKTATTIDDDIVDALQQPLMFLFLIIGLSIVVQWITFDVDTEQVLVNILNSLIAVTIFWTGYRLVNPISLYFDKFIRKIAGPVANEVRDYLLKALKIFLVASGIIAVLSQWGINPWPYFAGIGVLSLPIAFAAKDSVSNVFGGIKLILIDQVFRVGDWIETPSTGNGTVEAISLSTIRVRKFSKAILTVPNGIVASEPITNWTRMTNRRIKMDIGLTYDSTSGQFKAILGRIRGHIAGDERIDHSVTEMVHMTQFSASSIDINLYYFTRTTNWQEWRQIIEEHMLAFMAIIEEEGSAIAFPTRSIQIKGMADGLIPASGD